MKVRGATKGPLAFCRKRRLLCLQNLNDPIDDRRDGLAVETTRSVEDQVGTGRKEPVWPDIAWLSECSLCKINIGDTNGMTIADLLARDLAENDIVSAGRCND